MTQYPCDLGKHLAGNIPTALKAHPDINTSNPANLGSVFNLSPSLPSVGATCVNLERCSMINIDPETGDASGVALKVLAGYRRERANILFGQFLTLDPLSSRAEVPPPVSAASARSTGAENGAIIGTGGTSTIGNVGGERNLGVHASPATEKVVNGAIRLSGVDLEEAGKANVSPDPFAVGGWKLWVTEGMEVAGEA